MRTAILLLVAAVVLCCIAAEQPAADQHPLLPTVLTKEMIEKKTVTPLHSVKFNGRDYWVSDLNLGEGVPCTQIGIYAPHGDGTFHLCVFAESWAAGSLQPTLDEKTGILELKERANSDLKGQVVLSCNLKTIGTQHSIRAR